MVFTYARRRAARVADQLGNGKLNSSKFRVFRPIVAMASRSRHGYFVRFLVRKFPVFLAPKLV
jgi:hypothetical protein